MVAGLPLTAADFPLVIERDGAPMAFHAWGINNDGSFDYIHEQLYAAKANGRNQVCGDRVSQ